MKYWSSALDADGTAATAITVARPRPLIAIITFAIDTRVAQVCRNEGDPPRAGFRLG